MSSHRKDAGPVPRYRAREGLVIGLVLLLGAVSVALKLTHVTAWTWTWALSPLWGGGLAILLTDLAAFGAVFGPSENQ